MRKNIEKSAKEMEETETTIFLILPISATIAISNQNMASNRESGIILKISKIFKRINGNLGQKGAMTSVPTATSRAIRIDTKQRVGAVVNSMNKFATYAVEMGTFGETVKTNSVKTIDIEETIATTSGTIALVGTGIKAEIGWSMKVMNWTTILLKMIAVIAKDQ